MKFDFDSTCTDSYYDRTLHCKLKFQYLSQLVLSFYHVIQQDIGSEHNFVLWLVKIMTKVTLKPYAVYRFTVAVQTSY